MYLYEMLILENLYFPTNVMKLSGLEPESICIFQQSLDSNNFDSHPKFGHFEIHEVTLLYCNGMLILENIHFHTNIKKLSGLEPKIW